MQLQEINVDSLKTVANTFNLRKDLHTFVEYVSQRDVKRSYRENMLNKTDFLRLAKLLSAPQEENFLDSNNAHLEPSAWVNIIDTYCYIFGFTKFNTKGKYAGYSSVEPSFSENYIYVSKLYSKFLELTAVEQELFLLDTLVKPEDSCRNEFFYSSPLGHLNTFERDGCRSGCLPFIKFATARRFLLELLQQCQPDVWYSVDSLIQYLKDKHHYFLIPKKPSFKYKYDEKKRYGNFKEGRDGWRYDIEIPDDAPDAFERVEGRYVERFLENIPLILDYIELAYSNDKRVVIYPSRGKLVAFKLRPFFTELMQGRIKQPRVTVQPNFEILVESDIWDNELMKLMRDLGDVISEDRYSFIAKLQKTKVLDAITQDENFDLKYWLETISSKPLPPNVVTELQEWQGHAEVFTLYENVALLETTSDQKLADPFTVEKISPKLRIVKNATKLYKVLRDAEQIPLRVQHLDEKWGTLPVKSTSIFPGIVPKKERKPEKTKVVLHKLVEISLTFPSKELLERFRNNLITAGCPVRAEMTNLTLTFPQAYEKTIKDTFQELKQEYQIKIQDC